MSNADSSFDELKPRIRRVFIKSLHLNMREDELTYQTKLDEVAGLDSLAVLEFVAALEKEFNISFEPEMLTIEVVRDLNQLAGYIGRRTSQRDPQLGHRA
ncbi:MAG TPA: acyl carrier protein [Bryobacteraceae bacterium]|nr:acyl carrier protein [Bryobacteraceae bacterium]